MLSEAHCCTQDAAGTETIKILDSILLQGWAGVTLLHK
jgi:hypothetical protein